MKKFAVVLVALTALALIGCGPSAEQKKMMADLTSEVTNMVTGTSAKLGDLDNIVGQITTSLAGVDSLKMKFPKDTESITNAVNQLNAAKDRVVGVKDNVSQWISAYKPIDVTKMKFEEVIPALKKTKDELTAAGTEIEGALSGANTAMTGYKDLAAGLWAKIAKR